VRRHCAGIHIVAGLFDDLLVGKLKRARESTFPTPAGGVMMMNVKFELCCPISADLGYIRDLVRMYGDRGGLRGERLQDLVLAVNEAVTNVLDHGGAAGLITVRGYPGGFTVEVLDVGGLLTAEQVASARVDPTGSHGFGLWVIQHLCDEVSVARTGLGSVLRLDMRVHSAAAAGRDRHGTHEQRGRRGRHGDQETQPAA
jgi:serine/threonine-protein kinase RsbW